MASKRRRLKVAFVATIAAGALAAAPGCGSAVDVLAQGASDDGCPEGMPSAGAACGGELACSYGGSGCSLDFQCTAGQWQDVSPPCNPPPPDLCPGALPSSGDLCQTPGMTCEYEDVCEPDVATCSGGAWSVQIGGCTNPPPPEPECPPEPPPHGDPCYGFGSCAYVVETPCGLQMLEVQCDDVSWSVPALECPDPPPPGPCPVYTAEVDCVADAACRWLNPGCGAPPLPAPGCFAVDDCVPGGCQEGTTCQLASADCINCQTCDMGVMVCLP